MRMIFVITVSFLLASRASAAEFPQGTIMLLSECPGDTAAPINQRSANESFLAAILTPLLTGAISHGLKAVGTNLKEAAKEAQVDALSAGDHFFVTNSADVTTLWLKHRCVIVATKGTRETKRSLQQLTREYHSAKFVATSDGGRELDHWISTGAPTKLEAQLKNAGYRDAYKPAIIIVFDVELSATRSAVRLVPRYVVMDHSIREKADDSKARDMTFEISFTAPSAAAPFGKSVVKFDTLRINVPRRRVATDVSAPDNGNAGNSSALVIAGQWFAIPAIPEETKNRLTAVTEAKTQINTETIAQALARTAAVKLGAAEVPVDCPAPSAILEPLANANADILAEKGKPTSEQDAVTIARLTQVNTFYAACQRLRAAETTAKEKQFKNCEEFMPFDLSINVKEFRERPAAKFFGELLSDDTVRSGLTTAIVSAIDPATRQAAAEKEAADKLAARTAYEATLLEAQQAILAYETAKEEERALKYLDMEYKKRAVNRLADQLKLPRPYPESGAWFTG